MAKGRRRSRPGEVAASGWRVPGRRQAPVDDALIDRLRIKIVDEVREVRSDEEKRMVVSGRSGDGSPRRKRGRGGGGSGNSGEQIRRPGGVIREGERGKRRRDSGSSYRHKNGKYDRPLRRGIKARKSRPKW